MKKPFEISEPRVVKPVEVTVKADVTFISAGIKAAQNSQSIIRDTVIEDVSNALSCSSKDLEFLFETTQEDPSIYDFPDAQRRRMVIDLNNFEAAE